MTPNLILEIIIYDKLEDNQRDIVFKEIKESLKDCKIITEYSCKIKGYSIKM